MNTCISCGAAIATGKTSLYCADCKPNVREPGDAIDREEIQRGLDWVHRLYGTTPPPPAT